MPAASDSPTTCCKTFADGLRQMDDPQARAMIRPSQGIHLVLERRFLPGDSAIMVPETELERRVLRVFVQG